LIFRKKAGNAQKKPLFWCGNHKLARIGMIADCGLRIADSTQRREGTARPAATNNGLAARERKDHKEEMS
jgi:hypothetical protein